jgi:hypothetical protein
MLQLEFRFQGGDHVLTIVRENTEKESLLLLQSWQDNFGLTEWINKTQVQGITIKQFESMLQNALQGKSFELFNGNVFQIEKIAGLVVKRIEAMLW